MGFPCCSLPRLSRSCAHRVHSRRPRFHALLLTMVCTGLFCIARNFRFLVRVPSNQGSVSIQLSLYEGILRGGREYMIIPDRDGDVGSMLEGHRRWSAAAGHAVFKVVIQSSPVDFRCSAGSYSIFWPRVRGTMQKILFRCLSIAGNGWLRFGALSERFV